MKNKKNVIILLITFSMIVVILTVLVLTFSNNNKAKDIEKLIIDCKNSKNNNISCQLKGKINIYEVSAISAKIDSLYLDEIVPSSAWEGDGEDGTIDFYTDTNKKGDFNIATLNFNTSKEDELSIIISEISIFDQDYKEHKLEDIIIRGGINEQTKK